MRWSKNAVEPLLKTLRAPGSSGHLTESERFWSTYYSPPQTRA